MSSSRSIKRAYTRHIDDLNPDGVLVYDSDAVSPGEEASKFHQYPVPFNAIAKRELDFVRGKNLLVLGALSALFGLQADQLDDLVRVRLARRADLLEKNLESLQYGYDYVKSNLKKTDSYWLEDAEKAERLVLSGNQAITAGALHSGWPVFRRIPNHAGIRHHGSDGKGAAANRRRIPPGRGRDRFDLRCDRRLVCRSQSDDGDIGAGIFPNDRGDGVVFHG